jgi:hypothetical protein
MANHLLLQHLLKKMTRDQYMQLWLYNL